MAYQVLDATGATLTFRDRTLSAERVPSKDIVAQLGSDVIAATQVDMSDVEAAIIADSAGNVRRRVLIKNLTDTEVWIGATGVTTTTGYLLDGAKGAVLELWTAAAVFGRCATGLTSRVCVIAEDNL